MFTKEESSILRIGKKQKFFNQDLFCLESQNKAQAGLCPAVLTSSETAMAFGQQQICGHSLIVTNLTSF